MTGRRQKAPKERVIAERLMHGNLLGASEGARELAEAARADLAEGLSETEVRRRIRSRLESQGLTLRRQLLPSVSRRMLRVRLRPLLRALADLIADRSPSRRFGSALDSLLARIGLDQWLEDYIWTYAKTGEVLPIFEGYAGTVFRTEIGPKGDKTPTVWLVATPASDVESLIEWLKDEARTAFPADTFSKRFGTLEEGAQFYRWNREGRTYEQIAHDNINELYPDWCASDDQAEFDEYTRLVERETARVKKLAERTAARGDRIASFVSPEDTD